MFSGSQRLIASAATLLAVTITPAFASAAPSSQRTAAAAPTQSRAHNQTGHIFGIEISHLARAIPAGPEHGKLISSFAKSNNPHNFNHPGKAAKAPKIQTEHANGHLKHPRG